MKAINTGNIYRLYDDSMKTYDKLPAQVYTVCFHPQKGFWLEKYSNLEIKEKTYGIHNFKVEKVFHSFEGSDRNMGVILSGDKGIGKSLFAKMLAIKFVENGYPLIIVDSYVPGISNFLNSIEQEVAVLFDEFDKTFNGGKDNRDSASDPQTEMLSLFDGISMGKKMFIVTCNDLRNLNDYLVNRPGRFHYHFRFDYPRSEEIREYLQDKLDEVYWKEIDDVISFSKKINLNYDCLRAIAFELSMGYTFKEAICDLNIINLEREKYDVYLYFEDGTKVVRKNFYMDMFSDEEHLIEFNYEGYYEIVEVTFTPSDNAYDYTKGGCIINAENLKVKIDGGYCDKENENYQKVYEKLTNIKPTHLLIKRKFEKNIHYAV